jgi:D-inositol-3-phosphate glycosyltransferase
MNVFLSGLLPALANRGIATDVLTRGLGESVVVTRPSPGVRVFHLPCGWEGASREAALRALPRFIASARRLSIGRPDAVSAHYWMSGVAARALSGGVGARRGAPPIAFSFHTIEARKVAQARGAPDSQESVRRVAERELAGAVDAIVCLSRYDLAETVKWRMDAGPRGVVIPPGLDDRFLHPPGRAAARAALGLREPGTLFLLAARADSGKNSAAAVDAIRRMRSQGAAVSLLVAGQARPPDAGDGDGVTWLGPLAHAGMPACYAAADAVVCPSLYESFGLVPLESLAAGTPLVVPETVYWGSRVKAEGGGLTYAPSDPGALEAALARIASDAPLRDRLSAECRRLAAPFTWSRCAGAWGALLSRLSTRGGRPGTPRPRGALHRR